jgi:diguanylate cyclase (GGDEF)-like protein
MADMVQAMRGLPSEGSRDGVSPLADVEQLVIEGRYGRADAALRRLEALIPGLAQSADAETLLLALYGRALLSRVGGAQGAIAACDVLERAAHERQHDVWLATACALRARYRVDSGDIGGATADLARADAAEQEGHDLSTDTGYRLLDGLAHVYAGLRLNDRADEVRARIEETIENRRVLDQAQHWSTWSSELAARAMEPLAGGAQEPEHEMMARAVEIAARLDALPAAEVPATLRRGARGVRALSAAYRGRPSEALRLLGQDAFGAVGDLPLVERQVVSLAAMRAHALVGSLATARSLDDAATSPPGTLANLVLEVCRTRERLWLETYAGGEVVPVLQRMTELLVRLGWRGMDLIADTARQALEHQVLRTESRTDALTGVGNRRALDEELRQLLRFGPLPLALILVDVDHFKEVNDRFTHVIGDEVLRRVAASLSLQLRTDDQLLRYGGDEFVVLLPATGDEEANAVAERMAKAVAARPWNELADGLSITLTTGVAAVWSLSGRRPDADAEKLFRRADERLLHAKRDRPEGSSRRPTPEDDTKPAPPAPTPPPANGVVRVRAAAEPVAPEENSLEPDALDVNPLRAVPAAATTAAPAVAIVDPAAPAAAAEPAAPAAVLPAVAAAASAPVTGRRAAATPPDEGVERRSRRAAGRAAMRPANTPERRLRTAFDPDPDVDLDRDRDLRDAEPEPVARRADHRAAPSHGHAEVPGLDVPQVREPVVGARSRREARVAGRAPLPSTSAGRDAAEMEAAAREVARAESEQELKAQQERERRRRAETERRAEQERLAAEKRRQEQEERDRRRAEQERLEAERLEAERLEAERLEAERLEAERLEAERLEAERLEAERLRAEQERLAHEAAEAERLRAEQERLAREAAEAERLRAEQERLAREAAERERLAAEKRRREQEERERREREEAARRRAEQERLAREAAERERVAAERRRREQEERERLEAEARARAELERIERQRREREKQEAEARARAERERADRERQEAEARERAARERAEQERRQAEARERAERERRDRERREAEARVRAERARAVQKRREAEQQAAQRIREEAYARAAAQAKAAEEALAAERARATRQRREPLTDTHLLSAYIDEPPYNAHTPRTDQPSYTGRPTYGHDPAYGSESPYGAEPPYAEEQPPEPPVEEKPKPRRDPFGPPTSRQAIIDLSSRKRPRNPYKG